MTTPNRARPKRRVTVLALAALAVAGLAVPLIVLSVSPNNIFELEGDASDGVAVGDDWQSIADDRPGGPGTIAANDSVAQTFLTDGLDAADVGFTGGGSKDVNDIGMWQHQTAATSPLKNEIGHAFAAAYNDPSNDHLLVYFGLDRSGSGGNAATGFWFFKEKVSIGANGKFTGKHTVGDILITSDYVTGGRIGEINVFRWVGGQKPLVVVGSSSTGGGTTVGDRFCLNNAAGQTTPMACAASNSNPVPVPYPQWSDYFYKDGGSFTKLNSFPARVFYEGGIDLTQIVGAGESTCFASFMAMTRTSASTSAQLKDFALGDFALCDMAVAKTCVVETGVSPMVNPDGVSVHTKFKVTISNPSGGTLRDVQFVETATLGGNSGRVCEIESVTLGAGGTAANPATALDTPLVTGTAYEVANTLAGHASIDVNLVCDTLDNPFDNSVEARAKTFAGLAQPDLVRTYAIEHGANDPVQGDDCAAPTPAGIDVTKSCVGDTVTLVNTAGGMKARACFSIEVTNTKAVSLNDVTVFDPKISASSLVPAGTKLGPAGSATDSILLGDTNNNKVIDAGEGLCFDAIAPDNGVTDPKSAEFGNRVDVSGKPALVGKDDPTEVTDFATDTCPLCACPTCGTSGN
jgi:hypothetical protein